jgi:c-di-GMP-binding flagellar brake protein YcgR
MANQNQPPQVLDPTAGADDYSKYLVQSKKEIAYILRAIMQKNELVTAYFNRGGSFILTSLLEVDAENGMLVMDVGAEEVLNRKLLEAEKVIFVTYQDRVRVQFNAGRVEEVQFQGRRAFRVPFPRELLKLQRREFYRIPTPIGKPLVCTIPLESGAKLEVNIADISIGGIGIILPPGDERFVRDAQFHGCHFVLPDIGTIVATLQVRNVYDLTLKNDVKTRRAGCQFVKLPANMQSMIQRYIIKLERERRALQLDRE